MHSHIKLPSNLPPQCLLSQSTPTHPTLYYFILGSCDSLLELYSNRQQSILHPICPPCYFYFIVSTHWSLGDCSEAQICYYYPLPSNPSVALHQCQVRYKTFVSDAWDVLPLLLLSNCHLSLGTHLWNNLLTCMSPRASLGDGRMLCLTGLWILSTVRVSDMA